MPHLDRNSASPNRLRRNFQRLNASTVQLSIALNPSPQNAIFNTATGYIVQVDNTSIVLSNSTLAVNLHSTGSLLTVASTGAIVNFRVGTNGQVLTVSSTSSTLLSWTDASTVGGGTFLPLAGIDAPTSGVMTGPIGADGIGGGTLVDSNGNVTIDWQNELLVTSTGATAFNWGSGILPDAGGANAIDIFNRRLVTNANKSLSWANNAIGFYATAPQLKQVVIGDILGNAAVQSLVAKLATVGLFTNSTTGSSTIASTLVLAGPSSGAAVAPTYRQLSTSDITGLAGSVSTNVFPTVASDPSTPSQGQAWYNSTTSFTRESTSIGLQTLGGLLYTLPASTTVSGSGTSISTFGIGPTLPANSLVAGRTIQQTLQGNYSTGLLNTTVVFWVVFVNGSSTVPIGVGVLPAGGITGGLTALPWIINCLYAQQTTGVGGTFNISLLLSADNAAVPTYVLNIGGGTASIDTTQPWRMDTGVSFGTSQSGNGAALTSDFIQILA